jgi:hypothetical protein
VNHLGQVRRPDTKTITGALEAAGDDLDRASCAWVAAVRRAQHQDADGDRLRYRSLHVDGKVTNKAGHKRAKAKAPMLLSARADDGTVRGRDRRR